MPTFSQINSPEYQAELRRQAEASLAATRDLAFNQIGLGEQGLAQQENTIKQQNALANQNLDLNQTDIQRQYDALGKQLIDEATKSRGYLTENFNNLGLLQSGLTASGLGDIQKTLVKGQTESEQDRASRLASIALQRAGLTTAMQSDLSNIGLQRAGLGLKRTEVQQGYAKDVTDYVNQLLQQQYDTETKRIAAEQAAADRAAKNSNPFAGITGGNALKTTPQAQNIPQMIGNIPLSELQADAIPNGNRIDFNTSRGILSREQMADFLSGNAIVGMDTTDSRGRSTQKWKEIYGQILNNFKETGTPQPQKTIQSYIPIPGMKTNTVRGF
jgi:hypothetical protein